jgi:hypothetical protein
MKLYIFLFYFCFIAANVQRCNLWMLPLEVIVLYIYFFNVMYEYLTFRVPHLFIHIQNLESFFLNKTFNKSLICIDNLVFF